MKNHDSIENELNAIRLSLYEETKNMSSSELTAYIKEQTEPLLKMHGISVIRATRKIQADAKLDGRNKMELAEINDEISAARKERRELSIG